MPMPSRAQTAAAEFQVDFPAFESAVRWPLGDGHTLVALSDGFYETPLGDVVRNVDVSEAVALQHAAARSDPARITHMVYLLLRPTGGPILFDAGMGAGWGPSMGHLSRGLSSVGISADEIAMVCLTHLHLDHSAGLIDRDGSARFPNATVVLHEREHEYWLDEANAARASEDMQPWFAGARAAVSPYSGSIRTFIGGDDVVPGVRPFSLFGHTPGHCGFVVSTRRRSVHLIGDVVHLPAVQGPQPCAGMVFDVDAAAAAHTRRKFLERAARDDLVVAGGHTEYPGLARVRATSDGYCLEPELWANWV